MKKLLILLLLNIVISYGAIAQSYLLHGNSMREVKEELKKYDLTEADFQIGIIETEASGELHYLTFYDVDEESQITFAFRDDICTTVMFAREYSLLNETVKALNYNTIKMGEYWYNYKQFATYKYEIVREETYFYMLITVTEIHQ